ncbi:MAG: hypothetical protein AAGF86_02855, partial [Pseudomonadota bacterium]
TCQQYSVFQGFGELFENFEPWLAKQTGARVHGHLYGPERIEYDGRQTHFSGALSDVPEMRDYNPQMFLNNLLWNTQGERQCFQFGPSDTQEINWRLAQDPNAQISVISGCWARTVSAAVKAGESGSATTWVMP